MFKGREGAAKPALIFKDIVTVSVLFAKKISPF